MGKGAWEHERADGWLSELKSRFELERLQFEIKIQSLESDLALEKRKQEEYPSAGGYTGLVYSHGVGWSSEYEHSAKQIKSKLFYFVCCLSWPIYVHSQRAQLARG